MPNIKNQEKRVLTNAKRTVRNVAQRSELKSAIKAVRVAADKDTAKVALDKVYQLLDESVTSNIHHRNYANREKSRLAKLVNRIEK